MIYMVRTSGAWIGTKLALEFLILTAARSGEVRAAAWSEIDLERREWNIPGGKTKSGRPFRVPLSGPALAVLAMAEKVRDGSGFVFPSVRGLELSDNTLSKLFRDNGIKAVPHGFRSSFRTWASDSGRSRDLAEAALSHAVGDQTERAYARSDMFERRRKMMDDWARYLEAYAAENFPGAEIPNTVEILQRTGTVIPFFSGAFTHCRDHGLHQSHASVPRRRLLGRIPAGRPTPPVRSNRCSTTYTSRPWPYSPDRDPISGTNLVHLESGIPTLKIIS